MSRHAHRSFSAVVMTLVLLMTLLPLSTGRAQDDCSRALPPRLVIGQPARVTFTDGTALRVRETPGTASPIVDTLPEGTPFTVLEGPTCAGGLYWWHIANGVEGWIAEGTDVYYAEPIGGFGNPGPFAWNWEAFVADDAYLATLPDPLTITPPARYSGHLPLLPVELSAVRFAQDAGLDDAQLALLAQNGFVVVPAGLAQFDDAYREGEDWPTWPLDYDFSENPEFPPADYGHGYFVTTDAVLHALHYIFDNLLTDLEQLVFYDALVNEVVMPALQQAQQQALATAGTPLAPAAHAAEVYLAVALQLLAPTTAQGVVSSSVAAEVQAIAALALAGEGQLDIAALGGYREDFSQYRPRGHYAGDEVLENYFRGMMWLSRITFVANDDAQTLTALMLLRALRASPEAADSWQRIHNTLSFLIGPIDDLGPVEYSVLADQIFGAGMPLDALSDATRLATFKQQISQLPAPRVNGMVLPVSTQAGEVATLTRGFRFMGQRFTFDAYAMQQLMYPYVGDQANQRALPLALDVPAALGSETAYALAAEAGATHYLNYDTQMTALRGELSALPPNNWLENIYGGWLWALQPLWQRDAAAYPPLMNTEAWLRKDLQTGLASYTELKHDTVLYVKQPTGFGGGGSPLTSYGYVEPNPLVFARVAAVALLTYEGLDALYHIMPGSMSEYDAEQPALMADMEELRSLSANATRFAQIARKELTGAALTEEDYWLIYGFGQYMNMLLRTLYQGEGEPDPVALVTDIASNTTTGTVLQEGVGGVDYIYVVVPGVLNDYQVVRGGVFSYYEFIGDINQRMTDAAWREALARGNVPPRPAWTSVFISGSEAPLPAPADAEGG